MRGKTKLFDCSSCNKEVFRLGEKVNKDRKLCGVCNFPIPTQKQSDDVLKCLIDNDIQAKLDQTREILDKAQEIWHTNKYSKEGSNRFFYGLWMQAKRELKL